MRKLLLAFLTMAALAACSTAPSVPVDDKSVNAGAGGTDTTGTSTAGTNSGNIKGNAMAGDALHDPSSPLAKRNIYFEYDSYVVREEFKPMVQAHAAYLAAHPSQKLTIEGNTDERGSPEYNIALAQRRADAAKKMLILLGASDGQIETVSLGKEKPRNPGKDEAAYAENRRDDLIYVGQ